MSRLGEYTRRGPHALLLASHSFRSISRGSTTSSRNSQSVIRDLAYSGSKYTFFSSAAGFFPLGFALDFLPREGACVTSRHAQAWRPQLGPRRQVGLSLPVRGAKGVTQAPREPGVRGSHPMPVLSLPPWPNQQSQLATARERVGSGDTSQRPVIMEPNLGLWAHRGVPSSQLPTVSDTTAPGLGSQGRTSKQDFETGITLTSEQGPTRQAGRQGSCACDPMAHTEHVPCMC